MCILGTLLEVFFMLNQVLIHTCLILDFQFSLLIYIKMFFFLIFVKEWKEDKYPPWAHGPGYVVSHDIAKIVHEQHKSGSLKVQLCIVFFLYLFVLVI